MSLKRRIPVLAALVAVAATCAFGVQRGDRHARAAERPGHPHLVAQRHHRPDQVDLGEGRHRLPPGAPRRHVQGPAAAERGHPDQGPARPAVGRAAGRLPAVGRRRPGLPGHVGQGRRHHRRHQVVDRPDAGQVRPRTGRSTASSTACRSAAASSASGTARTCSQQAGITAPPKTMDELNAAVTKLKAKGIAPIARRRQGPLARRVLLRLLRHPRVLRRRAQAVGEGGQARRPVLGRRPART